MRIASLNIHGGRCGTGDLRHSLPEIADVLKSVTPDVCLLQEVDRRLPRSRFTDQAATLSRSIRSSGENDWYFAFFGVLNFGPFGQYGNAILSRAPFTDIRRLKLPAAGGESRGAVRVCFPELLLSVWNTHLGLRSEWRQTQLERLAGALQTDRRYGYSILLGGDFNASLDSQEMERFLAQSGLVVCSADQPTFPASAPDARIDYLLSSPTIVTSANGVIARPTATDHCLLWADVVTSGSEDDEQLAVN